MTNKNFWYINNESGTILLVLLSEKIMLYHYQFIKSRSYESFRLHHTIHQMLNKDVLYN